MSTHHGKDGTVKVAANTVAEIRSWSVNQTVDTVDTKVMGSAWGTHLVGIPEFDGEMECFWDEGDTNGQEALTIGASVTLNLYPEGASSTDKYYTGTASVTRIGIALSVDGGVMRTIGFKGNGALSGATVA